MTRRLTDRELSRLLKVAREEWSKDDLARLAAEELAELRALASPSPSAASGDTYPNSDGE
jgi:hypothetical protein